MFDLGTTRSGHYRDHVEAGLEPGSTPLGQVPLGRADDLPLLGGSDSLLRGPVRSGSPGFHFDKRQCLSVTGNNSYNFV